MINPRHLATLVAISEHGSFSAAGLATGRSHSAVSLHVKALEAESGTILVDRTRRPPTLTPDGEAMVEHARRLARIIDDIRLVGQGGRIAGRLSVGIVPTAMAHVAPPALARLKDAHPELRLAIRTGLSGELAEAIRSGELDAALVTAPQSAPEDLTSTTVAREPLIAIAPEGTPGERDRDLLAAHPFIWFSRKTWAGQQIERRLSERGIAVRPSMEIDSLEAIEALVRHGLGVSVVPDRGLRPGVVRAPFCAPQAERRLVLMSRPGTPRQRLIEALERALVADVP